MNAKRFRMTLIASTLAFPAMALAAGNVGDDRSAQRTDRGAPPRGETLDGRNARTDVPPYSDRARMGVWTNEREQLEQALRGAHDRDFFRQELERRGFMITSINESEPDYLEYEIVKGGNSYEVQIDFDDNAKRSTSVDVTTNMWKADATERALKDTNYRAAYPSAVTPEGSRFSDRARMRGWTSERERLEQALKKGQDANFYRKTLTDMGYQITSVNDRENDYLEYEVVKNGQSFEVQIDLENGRAEDIDVTTNMWRSEPTERALRGASAGTAPVDRTRARRTDDAPRDMVREGRPPAGVDRRSEIVTPFYGDRARRAMWTDEKDRLEAALRGSHDRAFFAKELQRRGFMITAMNESDRDYLEYEVVKGLETYEVQIDFDEGTGRSTEVDVTANIWQADATERALENRNFLVAFPVVVTTDGQRYSDRARMGNWTNQRDKLEQALEKGRDKNFYRNELERMGYRVTAVNDSERDYAEYEVVRAGESFEVQIDFDDRGRADKIDVTTNLWPSEATERALEGTAATTTGSMDRNRRQAAGTDVTPFSDRARMGAWNDEKARLQQALRGGHDRDFFRKALEDRGYTITAINQNEDDYLEYEVVKGGNSFEVQVDFDKGTRRATQVDVTTNMWKADATERALEDPNYRATYPSAVTPEWQRYSDRERMRDWTGERDRLERELGLGKTREQYRQALEDKGYRITAVNDREPDYVEYEVVRNGESFEVQIDLDNGGRAESIDVTTNLWQAEETDRALDQARGSGAMQQRTARDDTRR